MSPPLLAQKARAKIIGRSKVLLSALDILCRYASYSNINVVIFGETGTGKELAARLVHAHSDRAHKPFVAINCAEFSEGVLESELFGHVRGAFSGAVKDRIGLLAAANGGTVFFDEAGDIPKQILTKLLRVIQEKEFRRIGDNLPCRVDVRFVFATNRNLEDLIATGQFREDFYYRLGRSHVTLPPLRKRRGDVSLLANHFLRMFDNKKKFTRGALTDMGQYHWPGNVRELEETVKAVAAGATENTLNRGHIHRHLPGSQTGHSGDSQRPAIDVLLSEKSELSITDVMRALKISRTSAWRLLNDLISEKRVQREGRGRATVYRVADGTVTGKTSSQKARNEPPKSPRDQDGTMSQLNRDQVKLLQNATEERAIADLMALFGRKNRTKFRKKYIEPLIEAGLLKLTIPEKPRSRNQKYIATPLNHEEA